MRKKPSLSHSNKKNSCFLQQNQNHSHWTNDPIYFDPSLIRWGPTWTDGQTLTVPTSNNYVAVRSVGHENQT